MASHNESIPKTNTPFGVYGFLFIIIALATALMFYFLGFWGLLFLLVILAFTTRIYTETVPGYFARIVLNQWTGKQRTLFPGLNFKLPWESPTIDIDLRSELSDVCEETWVTAEGAQMDTRYVYLLRPKRNPEAIITYGSFEPNVVKRGTRNLLSMMLSDYFGSHQPEELLDKKKINELVFESSDGNKMVAELEEKYGIEVSVRLEDVDYDEATQKARDRITNAKSFDGAVSILMKNGMSMEEAVKIAKLENFDTVTESSWNVRVDGLQNLQHVNFVGAPPDSGKKGGKK